MTVSFRVAYLLLMCITLLGACSDQESMDPGVADTSAVTSEPSGAAVGTARANTASSDATSANSSSAMTDTSSLIGPTWRLVQFSPEAPARDSLADIDVTATFTENGRVAGRGGCNRYSGSFDRSGTELTFGALAATKMACMGPAMEVEQRFFDVLRSVRRYEIRERRLHLFDEAGTRVLLFASPSTTGEAAPDDMPKKTGGDDPSQESSARAHGLELPFRAIGQEPGWIVRVDRDSLRYEGDYGDTLISVPTPTPVQEGDRTVYRATSNADSLRLTLRPEPCTDAMSGKPFPFTAEIRVNGTPYRGCAERL